MSPRAASIYNIEGSLLRPQYAAVITHILVCSREIQGNETIIELWGTDFDSEESSRYTRLPADPLQNYPCEHNPTRITSYIIIRNVLFLKFQIKNIVKSNHYITIQRYFRVIITTFTAINYGTFKRNN